MEKNLDLIHITEGKYKQTENSMALHFHERYEIYFLLEGERRLLLNNRIFELKKNDVVLFKKNILHRNLPVHKTDACRFSLEFRESLLKYVKFDESINLLDIFYRMPPILHIPVQDAPRFYDNLSRIKDENDSDKPGKALYLSTLITELLILLSRYDTEKTLTNAMSLVTHDIVSYLELNYCENLKLDDIVKNFHYTTHHLCKRFKAETGSTIIEYLNGIRIQKAMKELSTTDDSVTLIAEKCGFNSINHFILTFKKYLKTTPGKYRKSYRS